MVVEGEARVMGAEGPLAEEEDLLMGLASGKELLPSVRGLGLPLSLHCHGKLVTWLVGSLPGVWQGPCDTD